MGCGSSKNSRATGPTKKSSKLSSKPPITLFFDPLTTLKIVQMGSLQSKIVISSGESETVQAPIVSNRLYASDRFLEISLSQLKNFQLANGKIFPKISYNLTEKLNSAAIIASNEDYHSFSTVGTDLSNPEIKIVLPLHSVKPQTLMQMSMSIKDAKLTSNEEIKANFIFLLDEKLNRDSAAKNNVVACQGFEGFSLNGLVIPSITVLKQQDEIKEPYIIEYGRTMYLRLNGLQGFKKVGESICPGCSMLILNEEGEEIHYTKNMIPEENDYHEDEFTDFTLSITVGGENFKPLTDYWWNVRLWDNKGDGQIGIKVRYQGSNKLKENAIVYSVTQVEGDDYEVKCKGETGLLRGKFVYIKTKKDIADIFSGNLEKSVEVNLEFDEGYQEKKQNILELSNSNDGIEKKAVSWRLVSVTAPH